jgi:hypothetical protein
MSYNYLTRPIRLLWRPWGSRPVCGTRYLVRPSHVAPRHRDTTCRIIQVVSAAVRRQTDYLRDTVAQRTGRPVGTNTVVPHADHGEGWLVVLFSADDLAGEDGKDEVDQPVGNQRSFLSRNRWEGSAYISIAVMMTTTMPMW